MSKYELSELRSENRALTRELEHVKDNFTQILWIKNAEIIDRKNHEIRRLRLQLEGVGS